MVRSALICLLLLLCSCSNMMGGFGDDPAIPGGSFYNYSAAGREYYIAVPTLFKEGDASLEFRLYITSQLDASGTIEIPGIAYSQTFNVEADRMVSIELPTDAMITTYDAAVNMGIHITADSPVRIYGLYRQKASADSFSALPVDSLGNEYFILSRKSLNTNVPGSEFTVVATEDNTIVAITPKETIDPHNAGATYSITLNRGEAYQLTDTTGAVDVTGTHIVSDKPVAVFGGSGISTAPDYVYAADYLIEQMPPLSSWGSTFYIAPLATRFTCTVRCVAAYDDTEIYANGDLITTLGSGEFYEATIPPDVSQYLAIHSSRPVLLAQFGNGTQADEYFGSAPGTGDPFMTIVPPVGHYQRRFIISTIHAEYLRNYINLIVPTSSIADVTIDGVPIDGSSFVSMDGDYSGGQLPVTGGIHIIESPVPLGVMGYGFSDYWESYGHSW